MPSILGKFTKQPDEVLDYDVSYVDWFSNRTDAPSSHNVTVPAGITKVSDSLTGKVVRVVLSGGTAGAQYKITTLLTTSTGVIKEADFIVKVKAV